MASDGAALVFCNAYVQPKQYFVFSNIAIFVKVFLAVVVKMSRDVLIRLRKFARRCLANPNWLASGLWCAVALEHGSA
jgi:hypothetical protein